MSLSSSSVDQIVDQLNSSVDDNVEDNSINEAYRWSEQCYLAHNLGNILSDSNEYNPQAYKRPWHYVTSVTSRNQNSSTANFMNRFHLAEGDSEFVNISTFERANMLWNMKLYKVFYKNVNAGDTSVKQWKYDSELPLIFESMATGDMKDYKDGKIPKYHRSGQTIDGSLAGDKYISRPQTGYGIKSFSWDYIGGNPETVRNDIQAKLVIEFQNFNQLSKIRTMTAKVRQDSGKLKNDPRTYSLLDLLGYGPNSDRNDPEDKHTYDPAFFEIKAVVGWEANQDVLSYHSTDTEKEGKKTKQLKDKVKGQKTTLFLTLTDHSFAISQLGTFTLTLDYRARLESVASQLRSNVLYGLESPVTVNSNGSLSGGGPYSDLLAKDIEINKERKACRTTNLAALQAERLLLQQRAWLAGMSGIFNSSFKSATAIAEYPQGLSSKKSRKRQGDVVLGIDAKPKWSEESGAYRMFTFQGLATNAKKFLTGNRETSNAFRVIALGEKGSTASSAAKKVEELTNLLMATDTPLDPKVNLDPFLDRQINWSKAHMNKDGAIKKDVLDVQIHFFYLGDLLNVMAHRAFSDQGFTTSGDTQIAGGSFGTAEKMKIISGPVRLKDPSDPDKTIECSLSDLPISVEVFADFWYRNVIQTKRQTYSFMEFVRDLGEQVINKAFGEGCALDTHNSLTGNTRLKTGFLSLPQHSNGEDPLLHLTLKEGSPYDNETGDLIADSIKNVHDPEALSTTAADEVYNYVVLWLENQESSLAGLKGNEVKDAENGIYHLKIHQGILQSIDFQKTDQPYLRETRFTMLNEDPLVHLSNVYNVRASMVGNTCFYPGDIVYIDPVGFGTSLGLPTEPRSLSNVMGLGGYHTIVSVSNKVSRDFTTEIEALWTSNSGVKPDNSPCEDLE